MSLKSAGNLVRLKDGINESRAHCSPDCSAAVAGHLDKTRRDAIPWPRTRAPQRPRPWQCGCGCASVGRTEWSELRQRRPVTGFRLVPAAAPPRLPVRPESRDGRGDTIADMVAVCHGSAADDVGRNSAAYSALPRGRRNTLSLLRPTPLLSYPQRTPVGCAARNRIGTVVNPPDVHNCKIVWPCHAEYGRLWPMPVAQIFFDTAIVSPIPSNPAFTPDWRAALLPESNQAGNNISNARPRKARDRVAQPVNLCYLVVRCADK